MRKLLAISIFIFVSVSAQAESTASALTHLLPALAGTTSQTSNQKPMQEVGPGNAYRSVQDTCAYPTNQPSAPASTNSGTSASPSSPSSY